MKQTKILHICVVDKFIPSFIEFIRSNFNWDEHSFILLGGDFSKYPIKLERNIVHLTSRKQLLSVSISMHRAEKIILHGLFEPYLVRFLAMQPWLLKKIYWVIWGGDLYLKKNDYVAELNFDWRWKKNELWRHFVIKRIGHFITHIKGDYELAQQWYGAKGQWHECFMYPSNLYKDYEVPLKQGDTINILVGNSADPTNNHAEIFEKLMPYKDRDIQIFCPLSYGKADYAERMAKLGKELFGNKFTPFLDFIPFEKYLKLLGQIDIAVFAHKRQQAMGNTITLLGLGKKVYMRSDVTPWALFSEIKVNVFDVAQMDINQLGSDEAERNKAIIAGYFSEKKLIEQFSEIFK